MGVDHLTIGGKNVKVIIPLVALTRISPVSL
jgi:hypothetical protein